MRSKPLIFIALGGNKGGRTQVLSAMRGFVALLRANDCLLRRASSLYETEPVGGGRQPWFLNAVVAFQCNRPPARLLRELKSIERKSGRRFGRRNGPRSIDLDLLDYRGKVISQHGEGPRPPLVLPHPEFRNRRFVLAPLAEIAPHWNDPVTGLSARQLLARLPKGRGAVQRILDSSWLSCDQRSSL